MLGTMKDHDDNIEEFLYDGPDYDDDLREMGISFDEAEASRLSHHQLEVEALLERCNQEINVSIKADEQARAEQDIIGQLTEAYRRQSLYGYRMGLQQLEEVLHNLAKGTNVGNGRYLFSPHWREQTRQNAVEDFVRINEEILRRQEGKGEGN